jgi:phosphatidylethanolamine-binding protein (PEBP) family uncharacterized protein
MSSSPRSSCPPRLADPRRWSSRPPLSGGLALLGTLILTLAIAGCGGASGTSETSAQPSTSITRSTIGTIALSSAAFKPGGAMPRRYTCDGAGLSPPLRWLNVPARGVELFLLAIDLSGGRTDAVQWAVGGLKPSSHGIAAGRLPVGAVVGRNSAGNAAWGEICGERGRVHHVAFLLYALNHVLGLKAGFDPALVRNGLKSATLARGLTVATYRRP